MLQFLCGIAFIRGNLAFDFCNGFRRNATAVVRYGKGPEIVTRIKRDLYPEGGADFGECVLKRVLRKGLQNHFRGADQGKIADVFNLDGVFESAFIPLLHQIKVVLQMLQFLPQGGAVRRQRGSVLQHTR